MTVQEMWDKYSAAYHTFTTTQMEKDETKRAFFAGIVAYMAEFHKVAAEAYDKRCATILNNWVENRNNEVNDFHQKQLKKDEYFRQLYGRT